MGRGGRRPGSGRKPTARLLRAVTRTPETVRPGPVEIFGPPADLTADEQRVWQQQAPHAFAAGTLTRASAMAFARYCQVAALERALARSESRGGSNHRGILKQINAYELEFLLVPCGKPLPVTEGSRPGQPNDDDQFFGGPVGIVTGR